MNLIQALMIVKLAGSQKYTTFGGYDFNHCIKECDKCQSKLTEHFDYNVEGDNIFAKSRCIKCGHVMGIHAI